jgi:predicted amidohydrolase
MIKDICSLYWRRQGLFERRSEIIVESNLGWKICPLVCYDYDPRFSRNVENYDLLIYVASWPKTRIKAWILYLQHVLENMSYSIVSIG